MIKLLPEDVVYLKLGDKVIRNNYFGAVSRRIHNVVDIANKDKQLKGKSMHIYNIKNNLLPIEFMQLYTICTKTWDTDFINIDECSIPLSTYLKIKARKLLGYINYKLKERNKK